MEIRCSNIGEIVRPAEILLIMAIVVLYSFVAYQRNFVWKDDYSLWSDCVEKSYEKARPHNNLGVACNDMGMFDKAINEINKAIDLKPSFVNAYISLGNAYLNKGLFDIAIKEYRNALRLKTDYAEVYVSIGNTYIKKGLIDRAIESYSKALTLKPDSIRARLNIASAYGLKGFTEEVLIEYKALAELQPDNPNIHYNLGMAYEQLAKSKEERAERLGQRWLIEQAIIEYNKTIMLNPNDFQARRNIERIRKWSRKQSPIN
ncbi:MAG: tetratricopeptide repeat protein [Desulfobacterales bacterium]|nr:tetratricopeptide repeat protein [Desulfobacterales bacterium]